MSVTPLLRSDCTVVLEITAPVPAFPCAEVGDLVVLTPGESAQLVRELDAATLYQITRDPSVHRVLSSSDEASAPSGPAQPAGPPAPPLRIV